MSTTQSLDRNQLTAVLISSIETELGHLAVDLAQAQDVCHRAQILEIAAKLEETQVYLLGPYPRLKPSPGVHEFILSVIDTLELVDADPSILV